MHWAAFHYRLELVEMLIKAKAPVSALCVCLMYTASLKCIAKLPATRCEIRFLGVNPN